MILWRQLMALVVDTLREASARRVFLGMGLSGTLSAGLLMWYVQTISGRGQYSHLTVMAQADPRFLDDAFAVRHVLASVSGMACWTQILFGMTMMIGLMAPLLSVERNAGIVAAPLPRWLILAARFVGCSLVAGVGVAVTFGEVWVATSMKFGSWHWPFLVGIATTTLAVSAMSAMMILMQVAVNSGAVVIVLLTVAGLVNVGAQSPDRVREMTGSDLLARMTVWLASMMPRTSEISAWTGTLVGTGVSGDTTALWMTALGSLGFLALASVLFARREF